MMSRAIIWTQDALDVLKASTKLHRNRLLEAI